MKPKIHQFAAALLILTATSHHAVAQSVCLPAPRLLTISPMGAQVGATLEVTITGQHLEQVDELIFSTPLISAEPKFTGDSLSTTRFEVTVAAECPTGIHEARVMSRLGLSTSRVFCVGDLPEVTQSTATTSVDSAMDISVNSICNATLTSRAVNHYRFSGTKSQRLIIDCAAKDIDSKTNPVVIVADSKGQDLVVERRGGAIDFTPPADGQYMVKVHDLTFKGGVEHFFRLGIREVSKDDPIVRMPGTRAVNSFSWPPAGLPESAATQETEPNHQEAQRIELPCDLAGSFFPAADVDVYRFAAKKGQTWWIEVGSERLGRPTDPSVIVQQVLSDGKLKDVVELTDMPSPVKRSSNGYSYDGPPYNAGSADVLGKLEIPEDGEYQIRISDLFGGTRNDPRNVYRLVVRRAAPDFALVAWALHMNLRNGDRNALSKPMALRGGSGMALEVLAIRRDGFDGEIQLEMKDLPAGVTATGFTIPKNKNRGILIVNAAQDAPRGWARTKLQGVGQVKNEPVTRPIHLASMAWPVPNAWSEIPAPRLLVDAPVSVGGSEFGQLTITPEKPVWQAKAGETVKVKLNHTRRGDFSGAAMQMAPFGDSFSGVPRFDLPLTANSSEAVIDLAKLKLPPGRHQVAFYGKAVAKYRYNPDAVVAAESAVQEATSELNRLNEMEATPEIEQQRKAADAALAAAKKQLTAAKAAAQPKDIVDIYVSEPITIEVQPAE